MNYWTDYEYNSNAEIARTSRFPQDWASSCQDFNPYANHDKYRYSYASQTLKLFWNLHLNFETSRLGAEQGKAFAFRIQKSGGRGLRAFHDKVVSVPVLRADPSWEEARDGEKEREASCDVKSVKITSKELYRKLLVVIIFITNSASMRESPPIGPGQ